MTLPGPDSGNSSFGPSPVLTPDQVALVRRAASRSPYYTTDGTTIRVRVISAVPVTVSVFVRQGMFDGDVQPHKFDVPAPGNRSVTIGDFDMAEGLIYNVLAQVTSGSPLIGQTYVAAQLGIGKGNTFTPLQAFLGDVVTATELVGWPGSTIQHSVDTEPVVRTITGTTPALGAEVLETVPAGARWELQACRFQLTTSANVGNRVPQIQVQSGGVNVWATVSTFQQSASRVINYNTSQLAVYQQISVAADCSLPLPYGLRLLAGQTFGTSTSVLQVNDQWAAPVYTVREWQEGT